MTNITSIEISATIGYIARIIFTVFLLAYKLENLYKFVSRTCVFPRIGWIFTPFMSSFLLTVLVYDFEDCSQMSDMISTDTANWLSSTYRMIALILFAVLFLIYVIKFARGRPRKKKIVTSLYLLLILCGTIGSMVGFMATFELISQNKMYPLLMFDMYSFLLMILFLLIGVFRRQRDDSTSSSITYSLLAFTIYMRSLSTSSSIAPEN